MPKRTFSILIVFVLAFAFAAPAYAQGNSNSAKEKALRTNSATGTPVVATTTERRLVFQKEIALRQAQNAARVLSATVTRIESIIARIQSRIEKVKAAGGSTTKAESAVTTAKKDLEQAKTDISGLAKVDLTGTTAQENFAQVRGLAAAAKDQIIATRKVLIEAVSSLNMGTTTKQ